MERISGPGHVNGQFSAGNPAIGQQATMVTAKWANDVQEELCTVVTEAGLVLDGAQTDQLYQAIVALVAGVVGDGSGAVPTTRQLTVSGLVVGGGDLAANRNFDVPKASAAEVAAGTDDTKAITPLALQGGAGASLMAGIGYKTIYGLMFQWSTYTVSANSSANFTLPLEFPTMCVHADCSGGRLDFASEDNNPFVSAKSATAITIFNSNQVAIVGTYFAIGF